MIRPVGDPIYSIIDIETTGGQRMGNRIIEIAIINFQNGKVIEEFETLIHPERYIPVSISYFTGISNEMVQEAPKFHQVAKKIVEMTKDSIFVAHNVYFDFNFIKSEFASLGYKFFRPRLCTVRLSRKLISGHRSYSLGNVCQDLGIEIQNRHRAMGDAKATVELLKILLEKKPNLDVYCSDFEERIQIPPNVSIEDYNRLPESPGIYYFWDKDDSLLYVGKSINIKKRVSSHFRLNVNNPKEHKLKSAIQKITFEIHGSDLCAKLAECHQIKSLRPIFNRSMNRVRFRYCVLWQKDLSGFLVPSVSTVNHPNHKDVMRATSKKTAKTKIARIYKQALGIDLDSIFFVEQLQNFKNALGAEFFNQKISTALRKHSYQTSDFHIVQPGRTGNEKAYIIVENSKLSRIEYWDENGCATVYSLQEDVDMKKILLTYLENSKRQPAVSSKNQSSEGLISETIAM